MPKYNCYHVWHVAVAHLNVEFVANLVQSVMGREVFSEQSQEFVAELVLTCLLTGGLNHVMFLFLFFFFLEPRISAYSRLPVCPLQCIASIYSGSALENSLLSHKSCERQIASICGSCF